MRRLIREIKWIAEDALVWYMVRNKHRKARDAE